MKTLVILCLLLLSGIHTNAQLRNADFEDWTLNGQLRYYPTDWPEMEYNYCFRDSIAHSGSYALQVNVWWYYMKSVAVQKFPVTGKPYELNGYYKYTDNIMRDVHNDDTVIDVANAIVYMTKWDSAHIHTDTIGYGFIQLFGTKTYKPFSCYIQYDGTTAMPDSITVVFDPSVCRRDERYFLSLSSIGFNSFLSIDDLSLADVPNSIERIQNQSLLIYPNPASNLIRIENMHQQDYAYAISDVTGKSFKTGTIDTSSSQIDIGCLPVGVYQISLQGKKYKDETISSFIKQ